MLETGGISLAVNACPGYDVGALPVEVLLPS